MKPRIDRRGFLASGWSGLLASQVAWAAVGLSGCSPRPPLLRAALNDWIGYAFLYLARDRLAAQGGQLRLIEFPSNTAAMTALFNGDVGIAALTLDEVLRAREGGLDAQVVLVMDQSHGADVVMARPEFGGLERLKGLRVGVEASAVGALMLSKLLQAAGLNASDVVKVDTTADRHVEAYREGEVDVVVTFEPFASALRQAGAVAWVDSRQFPGLIVDVLVVRRDHVPELREGLRGLVAAHFESIDAWRKQPQRAEAAMAGHLQMTPAEVAEALKGLIVPDLAANRAWLSGGQPKLLHSAQALGTLMTSEGLLRHMPDLDDLCEPAFLPGGNT